MLLPRLSLNTPSAPLAYQHKLTNRSQVFSVDGVQSKPMGVGCSVPQGSVLGPLEIISYTEDVVDVFSHNLVRHHLFADDKQLYRSGKITEIEIIRKSSEPLHH